MDCRMRGIPVLHFLLKVAQIHGHWAGDAIQSYHPSAALFSFCLQPFPASASFPMSALRIRWPKYWSFNFSISSSNDYSGLISFRMDWFDLLAVHPDTQIKSGEWGDWRRVNSYELKRYRKTAPWAYVSVPPSLVSKAMLLVYLGIVGLGNTHKWSLKKG